jgi:hypothetical protein
MGKLCYARVACRFRRHLCLHTPDRDCRCDQGCTARADCCADVYEQCFKKPLALPKKKMQQFYGSCYHLCGKMSSLQDGGYCYCDAACGTCLCACVCVGERGVCVLYVCASVKCEKWLKQREGERDRIARLFAYSTLPSLSAGTEGDCCTDYETFCVAVPKIAPVADISEATTLTKQTVGTTGKLTGLSKLKP